MASNRIRENKVETQVYEVNQEGSLSTFSMVIVISACTFIDKIEDSEVTKSLSSPPPPPNTDASQNIDTSLS